MIKPVTVEVVSQEFTNKVNENMTVEIQTLINDYIENFEIGLANIINILDIPIHFHTSVSNKLL